MNVTVTFQKQKRIFEVAGEETVLDLKKRIEDWTGVPMAGQKLIVNGFALKDDTAKVSSLGLKEPCKILLVGNVPENEVSIAMKPMEELEKSVLEYPKYCENEELSEAKKNFEFLRIQEELMRIILK
ncbi:ubiquitin-like protein, partial [Rozella allomycis CSF55]